MLSSLKYTLLNSSRTILLKNGKVTHFPIRSLYCYDYKYLKYNKYIIDSNLAKFMLALSINYVKKKLDIIHESLIKILLNPHFFG
jgi:hypothetical protein